MQEKMFKEKYHIFEIEYKKEEIKYKNVDEIISFLEKKVKNHPIISFISIFDHYTHTKSLENSVISENILDAKNIIFCFGLEIPTPEVLAVRPRSIGVCETKDSFVINFLVAPNETANDTMKSFIKEIKG